MPLFRRMAKRGFTNARYSIDFRIVNLGDIVKHPSFASGGKVNSESLVAAGLIRNTDDPVKVLGDMGGAESLGVKLEVEAERITDPARRHVESAGGTVTELGTRRDRVRGVDRNSEDRAPKNLTKKPKRRAAKVFDEPGPKREGKGGGGGEGKTSEKKGKKKKADGDGSGGAEASKD